MERPSLPRYEATQRREFLKRAAALGALALVPGALAACSKDDKEVFSGSSTTDGAGSGSGSGSTTTVASGATSTTAASSTTGGSSGAALPDGASLDVAFTYQPDGSGFGPARNPYIVAWVEDASGNLVANISLWWNPPKGERYINNLATWYAAETSYYDDEGSVDLESVTGATRPAGSYTVSWDGTADKGGRAAQGEYTVFVESAREHGTHSLTSAKITLGTAGATAKLDDDGELSAVSATYKA